MRLISFDLKENDGDVLVEFLKEADKLSQKCKQIGFALMTDAIILIDEYQEEDLKQAVFRICKVLSPQDAQELSIIIKDDDTKIDKLMEQILQMYGNS